MIATQFKNGYSLLSAQFVAILKQSPLVTGSINLIQNIYILVVEPNIYLMEPSELKSQTLKNNQTIYFKDINPSSEKHPTLVFLHGNYSDSAWWDEVVEDIQKLGYRIILPDLRGFGKSSYNNKCSRLCDWASDVIELCHILGINQIILNGWSFGGAVSQKIAEMAPQLVKKIILTCTVGHLGRIVKDDSGKQLKSRSDIVNNPKIAYSLKLVEDGNREGMRQIFDSLLFTKPTNCSQERKARLVQSPFYQRCYPQLIEALAYSDIDIQKIKAEALLIHGNEDFVVLASSVMATAQKLGKLQIWQNHAHMIPVEDTNRYCARITEFICE